jgi:hypothetical protein
MILDDLHHEGARQIREAIRRVTAQPVRWVINIGGQDHRWLGNGYFQRQGAELIAHAAAKESGRRRLLGDTRADA